MTDKNKYQLPLYQHTVRLRLEGDEGLEPTDRLQILLTGLFQWMRVGDIVDINEGPASGSQQMEFDVRMTCPPHELGDTKLVVEVSNSRRVDG